MIFVTEDIGQHSKFAAFFDKTHGDTTTCVLTGTPASIMASEPPHTVAIDDDPLDSVISATTRTVYWNSRARATGA